MPTDKEFVESWPLYTVFQTDGFSAPDSISHLCPACGKETTWTRGELVYLRNVSPFSGLILNYTCGLCPREKQEQMSVITRSIEMGRGGYSAIKVQKIGQFPPQSITIDRDLEKRLGDSAPLYKNALICRGVNFGIGALAYLRRVVENKTNELIDVVAEQAASYGTDSTIIDAIRAARDERMTFDQRLHLASEAIPSSLKIDGANPLAALHGLLSAGLHAQSEEECIGIVDEIREVFEYVFARLRAEIEDRNKMISKVKKLFEGRTWREAK